MKLTRTIGALVYSNARVLYVPVSLTFDASDGDAYVLSHRDQVVDDSDATC